MHGGDTAVQTPDQAAAATEGAAAAAGAAVAGAAAAATEATAVEAAAEARFTTPRRHGLEPASCSAAESAPSDEQQEQEEEDLEALVARAKENSERLLERMRTLSPVKQRPDTDAAADGHGT